MAIQCQAFQLKFENTFDPLKRFVLGSQPKNAKKEQAMVTLRGMAEQRLSNVYN